MMTANVDILRTRDEILTNLLYYIAGTTYCKDNLVLQGGGALHFVYGSPRYSNDLDFVNLTHDEQTISELMTELTADMKLHDEIVYSPRLVKKTDNFMRISYDPAQAQKPSAKVEVLQQEVEDYSIAAGKFAPLYVESPSEIYADKIVATLRRMKHRNSIKATDLFDLEYIVDVLQGEPAQDKVETKAQSYGSAGWDKHTVQRVIDCIGNETNHESFVHIIRRTLMPDVFANRTFDADFFQRTLRHFERFKEI